MKLEDSEKKKLEEIGKCRNNEIDCSVIYGEKRYCSLISPEDKANCEYITGETMEIPRQRITKFKILFVEVPHNALVAKKYTCSKS